MVVIQSCTCKRLAHPTFNLKVHGSSLDQYSGLSEKFQVDN